MANRIKVLGYTRSDGVKVKGYMKRGPSSETYGTKGLRWNKRNNTLSKKRKK